MTIAACKAEGIAVGLAILIAAVATDAQAHSFKVALVAPISGTDASIGRHAYDGFRLATKERDGHPAEESDGHLGGLDVYILSVDLNRDSRVAEAEVDRLIERERVEIVASLAAGALNQRLRRQLAGKDAAFIEACETVSSDATTMDGQPFGFVFEASVGYVATRPAYQGYNVARLIDRVVRAIEGDLSNAAHVRSAIEDIGGPCAP